MGIKWLNSFLREKCKGSLSIQNIKLYQLRGRRIAIDISIYLYKFLAEGNLIENMYLFISILRKHNIIPIFVFDGKPSELKYDTIQERKENKLKAEAEYNELILKYENKNMCKKIQEKIKKLKRSMIRITNEDILSVKLLLKLYGIVYYQCDSEADKLIAQMIKKGIVWGCISDDTDFFVYGCRNIVRCVSLLTESAVLYDTRYIFQDLQLTDDEFRELCVLTGTDYNKYTNSIYDIYQLYIKYKTSDLTLTFQEWLLSKKHIKYNLDEYNEIYDVFCLDYDIPELPKIKYNNIDANELEQFMADHGFIFV